MGLNRRSPVPARRIRESHIGGQAFLPGLCDVEDTMRFLNPKTDFAFKRIFGSRRSHDVLLSFLNAVLGLRAPHRIKAVTILDPYVAPKIKGMKDTYLDVHAVDEQDREFVVEMQVLNVAGFEKRVLYNACKTYAGQIDRGDEYRLLNDVIAVTITDFVMFEELAEVVNRFRLRGANGDVYSDDLELVFAELPKFTLAEEQLGTMLDKWFFFLKHAAALKAVPAPLRREPAIAKAFKIANKAGLSRAELNDQERREMFIQDQRGALDLAEQRGLRKGVAQGVDEERLRIARGFVEALDDNGLIAEKTGLPLEAVRELRQQHQGRA